MSEGHLHFPLEGRSRVAPQGLLRYFTSWHEPTRDNPSSSSSPAPVTGPRSCDVDSGPYRKAFICQRLLW